MALNRKLLSATNALLRRLDMELALKSDLDRIRKRMGIYFHASANETAKVLPPGADDYLRTDNPRLGELRRAYRSLDSPVTKHTLWTKDYLRRNLDLRFFRGDNAFVYQFRDGNTEQRHLLTVYYLRSIDSLGLLDRLDEDDFFGVYTFEFGGDRVTSRDLVDSIAEIYFLDRHVHLSKRSHINILDIGAGYGRLAYRLVESLSGVQAFCVDAVAESTFISEYYLRFRGVNDRARVVELNHVEETLENNDIELACNIHSFSECSAAAVSWWLDLLKKHRVRYLMIVPNTGKELLAREKGGRRFDFRPIIESRGYRLVASQPKYLDPAVQEHGISPAYHFLFELGA